MVSRARTSRGPLPWDQRGRSGLRLSVIGRTVARAAATARAQAMRHCRAFVRFVRGSCSGSAGRAGAVGGVAREAAEEAGSGARADRPRLVDGRSPSVLSAACRASFHCSIASHSLPPVSCPVPCSPLLVHSLSHVYCSAPSPVGWARNKRGMHREVARGGCRDVTGIEQGPAPRSAGREQIRERRRRLAARGPRGGRRSPATWWPGPAQRDAAARFFLHRALSAVRPAMVGEEASSRSGFDVHADGRRTRLTRELVTPRRRMPEPEAERRIRRA
jgi:hypothetical protein